MNRHTALAATCVIGSILGTVAGPAHGVVRTWNGSSGGIWGIAGNWSPSGLPGAADTATFADAASVRTIDLGASRTVGDVAFTGAAGYRLNGQTLTLNTGNLTSTGGGSHRVTSNIGLGASGIWNITGGSVDVTGAINSQAFGILKQGNGTMRLAGAANTLNHVRAEGGSVQFDEGTFTLNSTTNDAYAALWAVDSTVTITHRARVSGASGSNVIVGGSSGASAVIVEGDGSSLQTVNQILVGIGGTGSSSLTLTGAATVSDVNILAIGFFPTAGGSTLTVRDGATLSNNASTIGVNAGAVASVTLRDGGSRWTTDFLGLGGYASSQQGGTGTVAVTNDASLVVSGELRFFNTASALTVSRATAQVGGLTSDAGIAPTVRVRNQGPTAALMIDSPVDSSFTFHGVIADDGSAGGIVKRGPGEQIFTRQQTYTGGTRIEAGTLTLGTHDTLLPSAPVTSVGGTLNLGGYTQRTGSFALQGGTVTGAAAGMLLPSSLGLQAGTLAVPVVTNGTVAKTTAGSVTLDAPFTASALTVNAGTLYANKGLNAEFVSVNGGLLVLKGVVSGAVTSGTAGAVALVGPTVIGGPATLTGALQVHTHTLIGTSLMTLNTTSLGGGTIIADAGVTLHGGVSGYGSILGRVGGVAAASLTPTAGTLSVGHAGLADGFTSFSGTIHVDGSQLNLLSSGAARLGNMTTLVNGTLASLNGIELPAGRTLSGHGTVRGGFVNAGTVTSSASPNTLRFIGPFTNNGVVNGPVAAGAAMTFDDDVDGSGDYTGNLGFNGRFGLGVGQAIASIHAEHVALAPSTATSVDLAHGAAGGFDQLLASGVVAIDGKLILRRLDGYAPAYGVSHRVIDAATRSGTFDTIDGVTVSPLLALAVTYDATGVLVTGALPGDTDLNRSVDFNDLLALARNYNRSTSATWSDGDVDGGGAVNFDDLLALARNYGRAAVPAADSLGISDAFLADFALARSLVPEPSSISLLIGLGVVGLKRSRR